MVFIETPTFTRSILDLLSDESYAAFQLQIARNPAKGKVIPGSGGIRKVRWTVEGRGKRGGIKIIYYWQVSDAQIWLLLAYTKSQKENLTSAELRTLKTLIEEFKS